MKTTNQKEVKDVVGELECQIRESLWQAQSLCRMIVEHVHATIGDSTPGGQDVINAADVIAKLAEGALLKSEELELHRARAARLKTA